MYGIFSTGFARVRVVPFAVVQDFAELAEHLLVWDEERVVSPVLARQPGPQSAAVEGHYGRVSF